MTRKDYVLIAAALLRANQLCEVKNQSRGVERAALCLADDIAADNAAFDRQRFLNACGVKS